MILRPAPIFMLAFAFWNSTSEEFFAVTTNIFNVSSHETYYVPHRIRIEEFIGAAGALTATFILFIVFECFKDNIFQVETGEEVQQDDFTALKTQKSTVSLKEFSKSVATLKGDQHLGPFFQTIPKTQ